MDTNKEKAKTAYIYARTSSDDADFTRNKARETGQKSKELRKKESIEEQLRLCEEKCHSLGLTIVNRFTESGYSGRMYPTGYESPDDTDCAEYFFSHIKTKLKKTRPKLGMLLAAEPVDVLVVRDLSRVVRPYKESFVAKKIWQQLRKRKTRLISIEEGEFDQNKFYDRLVRDLRMQLEDEIKQKEIERCRQTLAANKNTGYLASGVRCLGFTSARKQKEDDPQRVIPDDDELKTVRLIFDKYLLKSTKKQINAYFTVIDQVFH